MYWIWYLIFQLLNVIDMGHVMAEIVDDCIGDVHNINDYNADDQYEAAEKRFLDWFRELKALNDVSLIFLSL